MGTVVERAAERIRHERVGDSSGGSRPAVTQQEAHVLDQIWSIREVREVIAELIEETLVHGRPLRGRKAGKLAGSLKEVVPLVTGERLLAIYGTQLRVARRTGQRERILRTKRSHPYLLYTLGPSANHHPDHVAWEGTLLPVDDPWWDDHFPPTRWCCRCNVRQVSRREAERMGGPTERPHGANR